MSDIGFQIQPQLEIINKFPIIVAIPKEPPVNGDNNRKVFNYLKSQLDSNPISDMQCSNNHTMHADRVKLKPLLLRMVKPREINPLLLALCYGLWLLDQRLKLGAGLTLRGKPRVYYSFLYARRLGFN
jgi:hypothetical protein